MNIPVVSSGKRNKRLNSWNWRKAHTQADFYKNLYWDPFTIEL
jgi:hypothetical protein